MSRRIRVLLIEDNAADAELIVRELGRGGFEVEARRVATRAALEKALTDPAWDVVLSDYNLPGFGWPEVQTVVRGRDPDLPIILISGALSEDMASGLMRGGVQDFILKGNWPRLVPAVERELAEAEQRRHRRLAELDLRESEERYRRLVEHSPLAIAVHVEGRIVYANPETLRLIGAESTERLLGKPVMEFAAPESRESIIARIRKSLETGEPAPSAPERFIRLDGRPIDVEVTALPIRFGDKAGIQVIFADVTERKAAQDALARSEAKYRSLFSNFVVGVFRTSPGGRLLEVNPAFAAMYGYESPEAMIAEVSDVAKQLYADPADRAEVLAILREKGVIAGREVKARRRDGALFWVALTCRAVRDEAGNLLFFEGSNLDISDKKQQEEQLLRLNRLYRTLQEANKLTAECHDRQSLLDGVCRILTEIGGFRLAWLGLKSEDGSVKVVAAAGPALAYVEGISVRWDDTPEGRGPTGMAIREGRTIIYPDFRSEAGFSPWKERAEAYGLRSSGAFPLKKRGRVIGAFQIYVGEAGFIGDEEQGLLENLVRELELALQSMSAEEQRHAADLALKAGEEKYRMMVENLNEIIYIGDEAGNISFINPAVERILGYSPQEVVGRNILDLVHPEDAAAARQRRGLMVEGKAGPWEFRMRARDGSPRWVLSASRPITTGQTTVVQGVLTDISQRKAAEGELIRHRRDLEKLVQERTAALSDARAAALSLMQDSEIQRAEIERTLSESRRMEAALRESEDSLRRILQTTNEGFWRIDAKAATTEVNQALCGVLGRTRDEILGRTIYDFVDPANAEVFRRELAGRANGLHGNYEITLVRPDGTSVICYFSATPLYDAHDTFDGSFAMVTDITQRKRAEEELHRRTEELEAFNKAMVDREIKIIEVKEEVNRLCRELGRPPAYPPVWAEGPAKGPEE